MSGLKVLTPKRGGREGKRQIAWDLWRRRGWRLRVTHKITIKVNYMFSKIVSGLFLAG